jgi:hypothetical protein
MKLLLIAGVAVLSLIFAGGGKISAPLPDDSVAWSATVPIHSPR